MTKDDLQKARKGGLPANDLTAFQHGPVISVNITMTPAQAILACRTLDAARLLLLNDLEQNRNTPDRKEKQETLKELADVASVFKNHPLLFDLLESC